MTRLAVAAVAALTIALAVPVASADPAGKTTLEETVLSAGGGGFQSLTERAGEARVVRRGGSARAKARRTNQRRSLLMFAQLTDPQIVDEMSPARVDFADPAGGDISASWRPQEALGPHVFDQTIRNVNANRRSSVRQGNGKRARLRLAITTGDLADNQHFNETTWFKQVLEGGNVDPYSGRAVLGDECGDVSPETRARINSDVAARNYTGVQDYDDYRDAPADRFSGFYDPDEAPPAGGLYAAFPRYPGLMEAAQQPFRAAGIDVPWYISRGNHDGLVQGNAPASEDLFRAIAVGCLDVFPSAAFDPNRFRGASDDELFAAFGDPAFIQTLIAAGKTVAPDPDRRVVSKAEYRRIIGTSRRNGFGFTPRNELRRSRGTASYYAFTPKRGFRFISLDTVAEGGGQDGNIDHPQYLWLRKELRKAQRKDQLIVVFGHHGIRTLTNTRNDEGAGRCEPAGEAGCDTDPRRSTPLHRGQAGRKTIKSLLAGNRNVIAFVAGHSHSNEIEFFRGRRGRGFWQIVTASHVDWPQQSRLIEVMDNRDGTLSLFGTILDSAAPATAPAPRPAIGMSVAELASLSRTLAFNDPQKAGLPESGERQDHRGRRNDRNVELLIRDPR